MTSPAPRRSMSRRAIILLSVAGALVLLGAAAIVFGPAFYRDVIVGEQPSAPTAAPDADASAAPAAPVEDFDGAWQAAEGSYAGYRVDEVLNGTDVTVVGRTEEVSGEVQVQDLAVTEAEITVDVASIATDQPNRDSYFRDNALEVGEHPTATFRLTEPVSTDATPEAEDAATVEVAGELTLHGVTREVTAEVDASFDGATARVAGSIPITFADFDVEAPDLGFVSVEPEGFVEFLLVLEK
ncbi:YceI family protein [Microbacterium paludicola]|uniref:YceI family protein n=1 Tax=Microbacterium paludicola TaxID=300019 RepID=UPI0038799CEE